MRWLSRAQYGSKRHPCSITHHHINVVCTSHVVSPAGLIEPTPMRDNGVSIFKELDGVLKVSVTTRVKHTLSGSSMGGKRWVVRDERRAEGHIATSARVEVGVRDVWSRCQRGRDVHSVVDFVR